MDCQLLVACAGVRAETGRELSVACVPFNRIDLHWRVCGSSGGDGVHAGLVGFTEATIRIVSNAYVAGSVGFIGVRMKATWKWTSTETEVMLLFQVY